jgi:tetratricopeptide (TPR) repeat protein
VFSLLLAVTIAAPNPGSHKPVTAAGQTVLLLLSGSTAPAANAGDPPVAIVGTELPAIREEGGRVLVRSQGKDAWVPRAEVLTPKEAVAHYTELIKASPQNTLNWSRRAKAFELLNDWDAAIKDLDELVRLSPQSSAYFNNRANYYSRRRQYDKALAGYDEALKMSPTSFVPAGNRGNTFINLREWDKAIDAYDKALQINENYARAYAGRSAAWREKRQLDKALADAERAVELEPTSPHTLIARGNARLAIGQLDKATADFDAALHFDPYFAAAYFGRAGVSLAKKAYQSAIRDLDAAIRLSAGNTSALARRAEAWVGSGNPRRALADLDEALKIDPKFGPGYRQKAWLLATSSDETIRAGKTAVELARKAIALMPDAGGECWETLAAALAEAGDFTGAVEWQKKALTDAGYVKEKGDAVKKRLEQFEAGKPVRE